MADRRHERIPPSCARPDRLRHPSVEPSTVRAIRSSRHRITDEFPDASTFTFQEHSHNRARRVLGKVIADMSMSSDGHVADEKDGCQDLFGWFFDGTVEVPNADPSRPFRTSEVSAQHLRSGLANVGALVCGRRLFDLTGGWGGTHPIGQPSSMRR